jgi:hypothetical protein
MPIFATLLIAQSPPGTKAETLAGLYGETLGAAAGCPARAPGRLQALAQKASARIKATARDPADAEAAGAQLEDGIARGRREIESGRETCAQAESELDNLEHELGSAP